MWWMLKPSCALFCHACSGDFGGAVGRIVENLDFQQFCWILDLTGGFDQPLHNVKLVVDGQLHRNSRLNLENRFRLGNFVFMLQVQVDKVVAMNSVSGKNDKDAQVGNENDDVKRGEVLRLDRRYHSSCRNW